jgi:mono/diheme cytochrome c family protein
VACAALVAAFGACADGDGGGAGARSSDQLVSKGKELYEGRCAACHGFDLKGTDGGPSFLSEIYAPGHHPDEAFHRAVDEGVQPHHWNFGAMPPQAGFSDADVDAIIAYVRAQQEEAGID